MKTAPHLPLLSGSPRVPEAAQRFSALLRSRWAMPFTWGRHDCCLWAADAVHALLAQDPAAELRGTYTDAMGAGRLVRRLGGLEGLARTALGEPLRTPLLACQGDVGLTDSGALAVCLGEWWGAPTARGMGLLPLSSARLAWRVGNA